MFGILVCLSMFGEVTESEVTVETPAAVEQVETAARRYRISVYDTYRKDRPTYDQRIEQANELLELAQKLPQRSAEHTKLVVWFEDARTHVAGAEAELPVVPEVDLEAEDVYAQTVTPGQATETFQTSPSSWLTQTGSDRGETSAELPAQSWPSGGDQPTSVAVEVESQTETTGPLGAALKSIGGIWGIQSSDSSSAVENPGPPAAPETSRLTTSDLGVETETPSWETAKQELEQATADLQKSKQDFETLQTELRDQAQEDLQAFEHELQTLTADLENTKPLSSHDAMNLLMRVTALDFGRAGAEFGLAVAGEGNEQRFAQSQATTKQLLTTLRQRVAGEQFQGSAGERKDLLTKIDAILQLRQN